MIIKILIKPISSFNFWYKINPFIKLIISNKLLINFNNKLLLDN